MKRRTRNCSSGFTVALSRPKISAIRVNWPHSHPVNPSPGRTATVITTARPALKNRTRNSRQFDACSRAQTARVHARPGWLPIGPVPATGGTDGMASFATSRGCTGL